MKYGTTCTYKGRRRWGRHGSGGHKKNKASGGKGNMGVAPRPSRASYFTGMRWLENKRKRIAKHLRATRTEA